VRPTLPINVQWRNIWRYQRYDNAPVADVDELIEQLESQLILWHVPHRFDRFVTVHRHLEKGLVAI
jgi:hypothetical protein